MKPFKINVVNKHQHKPTVNDFYIGRGSPVGNQYSHLDNTKALYKVNTREEAVEKYEIQLKMDIAARRVEVVNFLNEIYLKLKAGEEVNLICYCAPKMCHGDVIRKIILSKL
jgi:hypothetical protein